MEDRSEVSLDAHHRGPLTIEARWRYRRYNAEMAEWVFEASSRVPVDVATAAATVDLG